jgi:diguanylate cyclase (GGDEF)-like protein
LQTLIPVDDDLRVAALRRYGVLDQPSAPDLEQLCRIAAFTCGAPAAVIDLIDADRVWRAAAWGHDFEEIERHLAPCAHVVAEDRNVYAPDARLDPRLADNPYVTGEWASVRLFLGVPLRSEDEHVVGALCVVDTEVRSLTAEQVAVVEMLGQQTISLFEYREHASRVVELQRELDHRATHDTLTGLANRQVLVDRLEHALERSRRSGVPPAVLFCDLDRFKKVNERFGTHVGDAVLTAVASRIKKAIRPFDTAARLGDDEFVVVCEDVPAEAAEALRIRLEQTVSKPVLTSVGVVPVTASLTSVCATVGDTVSDIFRTADARMGERKSRV